MSEFKSLESALNESRPLTTKHEAWSSILGATARSDRWPLVHTQRS
jgi:hypothetical protein